MSYKNGSCELSGGELWVNKEAVSCWDFTRSRSVCVFTELQWENAEPKGVPLDLAWSLTRRSQTHLLLSSSFVFWSNVCKYYWICDGFLIWPLQAYLSFPTLQPENIHDTSGQLGFVWQPPLLLGKEDEKDTKCIHSRTFIHSVNLPESLQMQNQSTKNDEAPVLLKHWSNKENHQYLQSKWE